MTRRAMRVYCARYYDAQAGILLSWHASARAAQAAVAALRRQNGPSQGPAGVVPHEIPRTVVGMVEWLNRNFDTDNG